MASGLRLVMGVVAALCGALILFHVGVESVEAGVGLLAVGIGLVAG